MQLDHQKLKSLSSAILELYRPMPTRDLPRHLISVLGRLIPSECISYNDFNPQTGEVAVTWHTELPAIFTKLLPAFEQHMHENPLIPKLFKQAAALPATRITDALPLKAFQQTHVYNEYYRQVGVGFQMACGLSTRKSPFVALALNREHRDFTDAEVVILNVLRAHMQQALDISHALESAHDSVLSMQATIESDGRSILCFDGNYRVLFISKIAEEWAQRLFHCRPQTGKQLPGAIQDCVRKLKGSAQSGLLMPRSPLIFSQPDGTAVSLRLAFDPERSNHNLVFEQECSFSKPEQLKRLGLSLRETEVAYWIFHSKTSWEIGKILHISPRTVDKHVERILSKLGANDRRQLAQKIRELCAHS